MAGWSWGSAWGDDALDEQEEEAERRVLEFTDTTDHV